MKLLKLSCITIGAALLAIPAFAGTQKGQTELSLFAMGNFGVGGDLDDEKFVEGWLGIGYFFSDAIELKANITGTWLDGVSEEEDNTFMGVLVGPDYHFNIKDSKFVPYVGVYGGANFALTGDTDANAVVDGHAGVKYFVGERTTINAQVSYQYRFEEDRDASSIMVSFGMSYLF